VGHVSAVLCKVLASAWVSRLVSLRRGDLRPLTNVGSSGDAVLTDVVLSFVRLLTLIKASHGRSMEDA
jgi:hypothetical protein